MYYCKYLYPGNRDGKDDGVYVGPGRRAALAEGRGSSETRFIVSDPAAGKKEGSTPRIDQKEGRESEEVNKFNVNCQRYLWKEQKV